MKRKRSIEVFSLSFLDCICCGFGAIILLFVLTVGPVKEQTRENERAVSTVVENLGESLREVQDSQFLMESQIEEITENTPGTADFKEARDELLILERKITEAQQKLAATSSQVDALEGMEVAQAEYRTDVTTSPVGVPTDSEYLVFIIDTSGSMRSTTGAMNPLVLTQLSRTLEAYPEVKALQVLDCSGNYLMEGTRGRWIPDSPSNRARIMEALGSYRETSASNPIPGLVQFFKDFRTSAEHGQSIGVYIFGDEFTDTARTVLGKIGKLNPIDPSTGRRAVTISAVGFPFRLRPEPRPDETGYKFANLMREMTRQHGGAFMVAGRR